jgi:hypothetical protein
MASRGRPPKLGYIERVGYVLMLLRAYRLAYTLAPGLFGLTARERQDLEKLPASVGEIVKTAVGQHRRYIDFKLLNYAMHPPMSGEAWRLTRNYRPAGGTSEQQKNYDRVNSWRETVYGPRIARVARDLVEGRWARDRQIAMPAVLLKDDRPARVGRVFGQLEAEIARIAGVKPRTLRLWRHTYEASGL